MSKTVVRKNESLDDALRRFKRSVSKAGTLQESRKREFYEKPSVKRKKKSEAARKRKRFQSVNGVILLSLLTTLNEDMKQAMRAKDKETLQVIRMLKASIQNEQIKKGQDLNDEEELTVLSREMKQRRDSLTEFEKADRTDLADKVKKEIVIVEKYLPAQLSEDEIRAIVTEAIATTGATSPKEFGKVMGAVMPKVKGKADGNQVNAIVKELLNK